MANVYGWGEKTPNPEVIAYLKGLGNCPTCGSEDIITDGVANAQCGGDSCGQAILVPGATYTPVQIKSAQSQKAIAADRRFGRAMFFIFALPFVIFICKVLLVELLW